MRRTCNSAYVCECLEEPQFAEWFARDCNVSSTAFGNNVTTNSTSTSRSTDAEDETSTLFDNVDPLSLLAAVVTGMAMLALIALSVLFARYRKRNQVVATLGDLVELANKEKANAEAFNKELKASLARAQKEVDKAVGAEAEEHLKQYRIKYDELTFEDEIGHGRVNKRAGPSHLCTP